MPHFLPHAIKPQRYALAGFCISLATLCACGPKKQTPAPASTPQKAPAEAAAKPVKEAQAAPPAKTPKTPAKVMSLAAPQAKFATTLFGLVSKKIKPAQNFVISPMSVYVALGMTRLGAMEDTAKALNQTLSLPVDASNQSVAASLGQAQRVWTQARPGTQLALANRLFAAETFKIKPDYVEMTKRDLDAGIQNLPFSKEPDRSRKTINDWVATHTKDRIKDLLSPGDINASTRLVLVNAIWFKGEWAHRFKTKATKPRTFHLSKKKKVKVPTMAMTHDLPMLEVKSQGYRALDLPYADGRLAMSIILPDVGQDAEALGEKINLHGLSQGLNKAMPRKIDLQLPKFTIDPEKSVSLVPELKRMGAGTIFGSPKPNFLAMADASEHLAVQDVLHKAMIIVDEKGAEAAAATAVTTYRSAAMPQTHAFHVDRPFLFMIRDKKDGAVLFAGRVSNPTK